MSQQIKPLGTKVLVKMEKIEQKIITLEQSKDAAYNMVIVDKGPGVWSDILVGQHAILFSHCHINVHRNFKDYALIDQNDIWGVING